MAKKLLLILAFVTACESPPSPPLVVQEIPMAGFSLSEAVRNGQDFLRIQTSQLGITAIPLDDSFLAIAIGPTSGMDKVYLSYPDPNAASGAPVQEFLTIISPDAPWVGLISGLPNFKGTLSLFNPSVTATKPGVATLFIVNYPFFLPVQVPPLQPVIMTDVIIYTAMPTTLPGKRAALKRNGTFTIPAGAGPHIVDVAIYSGRKRGTFTFVNAGANPMTVTCDALAVTGGVFGLNALYQLGSVALPATFSVGHVDVPASTYADELRLFVTGTVGDLLEYAIDVDD